MGTHTPGPWFYTQEGKDAFGIVERDGASILHMQALQNSTGASHLEANARLIAAAPDLLDALDRLIFAAQSRDITMGCPINLMTVKAELAAAAKHARAVIAKAKGES
jgi:hypothetical protein